MQVSAEQHNPNLPARITTLAIQNIDPKRIAAALHESGIRGFNPFTFDQVRVPGAGSLAWTVPTEDGPQPVQYLDVIILHFHRTRQYFTTPYDPTQPEPAPPDCVSYDGVSGRGNPGGACGPCPFGQFGGACHPGYFIYILFADRVMPLKLNIPRTSIASFEKWVAATNMTGRYHNEVLVRIGLQPRKQGLGSVATFRTLYELAPDLAATARSYAKMLAQSIVYDVAEDEPTEAVQYHICTSLCGNDMHGEQDAAGEVRDVFLRTDASGRYVIESFAPRKRGPDDDDIPG